MSIRRIGSTQKFGWIEGERVSSRDVCRCLLGVPGQTVKSSEIFALSDIQTPYRDRL